MTDWNTDRKSNRRRRRQTFQAESGFGARPRQAEQGPRLIGISDKDRAAVPAELSKLLANFYMLYLMTQATADLMTQRQRLGIHEKNAWMPRSLLE